MTPARDIQPRHSSSITRAYVVTSRPRPPYSRGTSAPNRPRARIRSTRACGYVSACPSSGAAGRTASSTNRRPAATTFGWRSIADAIVQSNPMPLDDLVLALQRFVDRLVRRARRGRAPTPGRRRLLVVQIDGLSRGVLEQALAEGRMPFLRRVIERAGWRVHPMFVGLPSSTPSFQLARAVLRLLADPVGEWARGWKWLAIKLGLSVWVRELFTLAVARDLYAGVPSIYVNYLDYDVVSHAYGPRHPRALRSLRRIDDAIKQIWRVCRRVPEHAYDLYILSDHGQALTKPFGQLSGGRRFERVIFEDFFTPAGARPVGPERPAGRHRLASGIKALRMGRAPGY